MLSLRWPDLRCVLALGAHSDDIEIGAGATLLRLVRENPRARIVWVVLAANGRRGEEARASAARFLADKGGRRNRGAAAGVPRRAFPGAVGRDQGLLRDAEAVRAGPGADPLRTGPAPGPPGGVRARLEHLPRPADPRVRDPEVGRRPRLAQPLRAGERRRRRRQDRGADAVLPEPGRQALVRRPDLPRPDAAPRPRMLRARGPGRGLLRPQGAASPDRRGWTGRPRQGIPVQAMCGAGTSACNRVECRKSPRTATR